MSWSWFVSVAMSLFCATSCRGRDEKPEPQPSASGPHEVVLTVSKITSSSSHAASPGYTFTAANLADGALNTSWQPATTAKSPHWVRLEFDSDVTISAIAIANGFQTTDRFGDEFLLNRKIASGRLLIGDGEEIRVRFNADARGYVRFPVARKRTRSVELHIDETHPGTKWNDLAISEIEVIGIRNRLEVAAALPVAPAEDWWTPPPGERTDVEALSYGFAGIDENDLGAPFTGDLKPVHGAPPLFEQKPPRRVPRDDMQKSVMTLRSSSDFDAGFNYLFLKMSANHTTDNDYKVLRAMQVREVVRIDESARMRRPPNEATFYLAEVHRGASFDLLVEGTHSVMGAQLEILFAKAGGAATHVRENGSYRLKAFGLGLRDVTGEGIFAMTPEQIANSYRTGDPVPVLLVFRTIPGRVHSPTKLAIPEPVIDESMFNVGEQGYHEWTVRPGRYWVEARSRPNGMSLTWQGDVTCDQDMPGREYTLIKMNCTVSSAATLRATNPSTWNMGPAETMSLYVARN